MRKVLTRIGPTWRFAIVASLVVVAAGYLLVAVLTNAIVDANLHSAETEARDTVARRVLLALKPEDMNAPLQGERLAEFDRFVRESVVSARTARIKIWAPDGRVIYADDPAIIGRQFPPDDELQQALLGVTSSHLLTSLGAENQSEANRGTLLEVYTPLIFPGTTQPAGAFEIYQIYEPVAQQVAVMRRYVLLTLGGGIGAFYVALLVMAQGVGVIRRQGRRLAVSEREFEDLVHSVEAIVWEANAVTVQFTFVSEQAERLLGYPTEDWVKTPGFWVDHMHPEDRDRTIEDCATATAQMRDHSLEFRMIAADGRTVWFRDLVRVEGNDGIPTRIRGVMFDITERKEAEIAVSRLGAIVESSDDMVVGIDLEGAIVTWNAAAEGFTHQKAADVMGRQLKEILPGHGQAVEEALGRTKRGERVESFETEIALPGGNELALSVSVFAIRAAQGQPVGLASIIRNVTMRKQMERQLVFLAAHDSLTGLYNRRRFEEDLDREVAQAGRYQSRGALLFLDLDGFKGVNDTLGHRAGDQLLIGVAQLLKGRVRETDSVARLGGDEFAVLLHHAGEQEALVVAQAVCEEIRKYRLILDGQAVSVTASIGVALLPDHSSKPAELLAHADFAMYRAKERGGDRVHVYDPEHDVEVEVLSQITWEQRIRNALNNDGFMLYAQPIRALANGVVQYELLVRMCGTDGAVVLPETFIPVAERSGLIRAIDRWVVTNGIRVIAAHNGKCATPRFSVNISGRAFEDDSLVALIKQELEQTGIDPSSLILEITETAAIADMNEARKFIKSLRDLGCRFAIDDFGAGTSSFYYLKSLPVDYIKIDGSFIRNLPTDVVDQHLVKAMVAMARALGNQTIAEFVEDDETLRLLVDYGVDLAQGYHIGEPVPLSELPGNTTVTDAA